MRNVYLYPVFEDKASFDDVMSRAAWYFEPWLGDIKGFHVGASFEFDGTVKTDQKLDPAVAGKVSSLLDRTIIHNTSATTNASLAREAESNAELLLVWDLPEDESERAKTQALLDGVRARGWLSYVVDKNKEMSHGCNWLWGSITLASRQEREALKAQSYERLLLWASQLRSSRAYVLGTGPNLEQAADRDFSDGDCIIANSIIKNKALMKRLDPVAVCACDPIFHAGVSLYAAEFRQTLIEAMDEYPRMYFFAPHRDEKIYLLNLPQRLHERCIFVPIDTDPGTPWNSDLRRRFYLVPEGNVLTQMMLPIAAACHDKISIIGCDGRPLHQNTYFWSHHKASQFNDQMQNIQEVHPAFFALRDYDDHYAEHCADTARIISNIEGLGKRVENLTDSYIPALAARNSLDGRPLGDDVVFVSINPNLKNRYGHLLGYDEGMREAVRAAGGHFLTLGSTQYSGAQLGLDDAQVLIEPAFSDNVYTSLCRWLPDVDEDAVLNFEREFEAAVVRHKREHAGKKLAYYLYMGSLPHAVALANVCSRHSDITATVNTFGECIMDCMQRGHIEQWTAFLRSATQQKNFSVLAITPQLQREVRARSNVDLPLCGHPTGAFSDARFAAWHKTMRAAPIAADATRLVFPGGFWGEKNFDLTCDIARDAHGYGFSCAVRTGPLESANRQQLDARAAILPYARTADGVLGDDEYRALFTESDIAVLTYRREEWRIRNSSVVIDCLYAGLPMVVVSGTWLADLVTQYGCGEVVERETATDFMAAIQRIRASYATYRRRTIAAARAYQSANSFADVVSAAIHPIWADDDAPFTPYDPSTIPLGLRKMRAAALSQREPAPATFVSRTPMPFYDTQQPIDFELTRSADCMFEELTVVRILLANRDQTRCVMIDVGAHSGGSFPPFIDAGWTVHAFEPDPSNRAGIPTRYLDNPRFILDPRALSDQVLEDVPFFTSTESTGISGLSAFHTTHKETARVSTTTLANVIAERSIGHVTLLKVDTEGFDLFVLKGMAWDRVLPDVVITEYENAKTERLGYSTEDQIRFLEERGYTVFISEWWPIVRYGIRHHWRSLYPAAHKRPDAKSWGNLIAFQKPPALREIYEAMLSAIDHPKKTEALAIAHAELAQVRNRVDGLSRPPPPPRAAQPAPPMQTTTASDISQQQPNWGSARMTPGRKRIAVAATLWGVLTLGLTAASSWFWTTPGGYPLAASAAAGAAVAGWFGLLACALAALVFLKRRALACRLAGAPGVIELFRVANALQRRRRPEALASARLLAALSLIAGAAAGVGVTGALSAWIWVPALTTSAVTIAAILSGWSFALLLALIRSQSEDVAATRYDRTVSLMQSDVARMQRDISSVTAGQSETANQLAALARESANRIDAFAAQQGELDLHRVALEQQHAALEELRVHVLALSGGLQDFSRDVVERDGELRAGLTERFAALNEDLERFGRNISARDHEFRSDLVQRMTTLRDELEYGIRRHAAKAEAGALERSEELLSESERRFNQRLVQLSAEIADSQQERLASALADSEQRITAAASGNDSRYLNFNRRLSDTSIKQLTEWAEKIGVTLPQGAFAYMAHRIEAMETVAHGRLAASVETQILRNLVACSVRAKNFEGIEIGTLYGLGTASLIEATTGRFETTRVTVVDPFAGYYAKNEDPLIGLRISREQFEANMRRLGIPAERYRVVQGFSEDEATIAEASQLRYHYLLIDGDHTYEGVRRDFENYAPMMERYGYVLIDDYDNPEYPGIQSFVDDTLKHDKGLIFVGAAFSTAVFRVWRKS